MKIAKADAAEIKSVLEFVNKLEDLLKYPHLTKDEELLKLVRNAPPLTRVALGYAVLVDNCADPAQDVLDFKPEIKHALNHCARYEQALKQILTVINLNTESARHAPALNTARKLAESALKPEPSTLNVQR